MPNKYSHAIVLSNYESHGLIDFNRPRASKPSHSSAPRSTLASASQRSNPTSWATSQPPSHFTPPQRIRLGSPSRTTTKYTPTPLHRRSSSTETQIYAPRPSATPSPTRGRKDTRDRRPNGYASLHTPSLQQAAKPNIPLPAEILIGGDQDDFTLEGPALPSPTPNERNGPWPVAQTKNSQHIATNSPLAEQRSRPVTKRQPPASQKPPINSQTSNWRRSSAVAVGGLDYASSALQAVQAAPNRRDVQSQRAGGSKLRVQEPRSQYSEVTLTDRAFAPQRPPSPPATPESERSFSLETPIGSPDPVVVPPPVPERSSRRTPPGPTPRQNSTTPSMSDSQSEPQRPTISTGQKSPTETVFSITTPGSLSRRNSITASVEASQPQPQPRRPKTSSGPKSPTFSITTRTSSLSATTSPWSPSRKSSAPSKASLDLSIDLTSPLGISRMPSQPFFDDDDDLESLPSTLDFNVQPWSDDNISPAIFRDGELNSERNSFASPEPTRASSFDSAAPPPIGMHRRMPPVLSEDTISTIPKPEKKAKPSLASLAFFRSAPKAIFYSQTRPATPPLPVSVSRTAIPSIPALFPGYKGHFPPAEEDERRSRTVRGVSREPQKRGFSVPPKSRSRRLSWFKNEQPDKTFSRRQSVERRMSSTIERRNITHGVWDARVYQ